MLGFVQQQPLTLLPSVPPRAATAPSAAWLDPRGILCGKVPSSWVESGDFPVREYIKQPSKQCLKRWFVVNRNVFCSLNSLRFLLGSVNGDSDTQWSYNWMITVILMFLMMMVMMKMMTMTMMITRLCREWHFCTPNLKQTKEDDCWKQNLATSNDPTLKGSLTPHLNSDSRSPRSFARELYANLSCCNGVQNGGIFTARVARGGRTVSACHYREYTPCKLLWNQKQRLGRWFLIERFDFQFSFLPFQGLKYVFSISVINHQPGPGTSFIFVASQAPKKRQAYVTATLNPTVGNLGFLNVRDGTLKSADRKFAKP